MLRKNFDICKERLLKAIRTFLLPFMLFIFLGVGITCNGQDCRNIPTSFSSYQQAIKAIKVATFKMHETVDTSRSSWIRGAKFYSCDSRVGFLIIKTDDREYIHQGVPIEIWMAFKAASSMGSYYQANIRNGYKLKLND